MVHRTQSSADDTTTPLLTPAYAGRWGLRELPRHALPDGESLPDAAYRLVHDELMLDGNARLNLATFVTTWMEPEAQKLMAETFDKNMVDKDEYPATAEIERRCVNVVANLFNAPDNAVGIGVSTIGSSEAVMLAGLAMKWRWRQQRQAVGASAGRPNMVMGSNVQVVWEKFCRYWDVEPRYVPMAPGRYVITPDEVIARCDENTIGVVAILGTTFTGELEPVEAVHDAVVAFNAERKFDIPVHVDAASGGFVVPFLQPDLRWDFRLPQVRSINVSGHKFGLVYPGVGFVVWRHEEDLPDELVFRVNYLGGDMPTFTLNFSRPGNQVIGQYYNFVRLGRAGYTAIMQRLRDVAVELSGRIAGMGPFELVTDGSDIPVFAFRLTDDAPYTVFHVSDELRRYGWQVPAYTMPEDATDVAVLRVVVREGFSLELAHLLVHHLQEVLDRLKASPPAVAPPTAPFSHT